MQQTRFESSKCNYRNYTIKQAACLRAQLSPTFTYIYFNFISSWILYKKQQLNLGSIFYSFSYSLPFLSPPLVPGPSLDVYLVWILMPITSSVLQLHKNLSFLLILADSPTPFICLYAIKTLVHLRYLLII